jgi:glc operon protein GlcG
LTNPFVEKESSMNPKFRFVCAIPMTVLLSATAARAQAPAPPPAIPNAPIPAPSLAEARKALDTAQAFATKINVSLSCAVVDSRGDLIALERMDKARFLTTDVARGKALSSAMFGQPSASLAQFGASPWFSNLNAAAQGRLYPLQGAVPLMKSGQLVGAIGCSGATGQQDEDAAKAAAAAAF